MDLIHYSACYNLKVFSLYLECEDKKSEFCLHFSVLSEVIIEAFMHHTVCLKWVFTSYWRL